MFCRHFDCKIESRSSSRTTDVDGQYGSLIPYGAIGRRARRRAVGCSKKGRGTIRADPSPEPNPAGARESEINESVHALAGSMYGISRYWHKRIVCAGRNTLAPYDENPPDLTVGEDDIVFLDLGPVFEEWEADFGRTHVVGDDPLKHKLRRDIEEAFACGKQYFHEHPEVTAAEPYAHAKLDAAKAPKADLLLIVVAPVRQSVEATASPTPTP